MKNTLHALTIVVSSLALFSFTSNDSNYQIECATIGTDGNVTIKIWDSKKGTNYKLEQARKDAIHAILYSGCSGQPPILDETEEQKNFRSIERWFFSRKGQWSIFTRNSSTQTILPSSIGDKNWKVYQVSVAKNELRKYLEEKKIIKSLTNSF